jgi:hypothetical protein
MQHTWEKKNTYRMFVGRSKGKRPLRTPRRKWEDSNKIDHKEISWGGMDWIALAQSRDQCMVLVNMVMNLLVP